MLLSFDETSNMISSGKLLHIAGTEQLLRKLPKGNWIGGSTEYFMTEDGGKVTSEKFYVTSFAYENFKISEYDENSIPNVTIDAYDNGFSLAILPFDSDVNRAYAGKAAEFEGMFIKNVVGWVSGVNLEAEGQTPIVVNGLSGKVYPDKAVVLHIGVPDDKVVSIGIVNIFSQDEESPVIEFTEEGFSVSKCSVGGKEYVFSDYIAQNNIDIKMPLVGDYSGARINVSFKAVEDGAVHFYGPVFKGIKYRMAKPVTDYVKEFERQLKTLKNVQAAFSCNCILNFSYGELEGKDMVALFGPITFGEVAYQLVNQTLVYVTVS